MAAVSRELSPSVAPKSLAVEMESPLQSSDTVLDLRLLASAAGSRQPSMTHSESDTAPPTSSSCSSPRQSVTEPAEASELDLAGSPGWRAASEALSEGLAAFLDSETMVELTELKARPWPRSTSF